MKQFTRNFRNYQVLFPGATSANEPDQPNEVSGLVLPTYDVFRYPFLNGALFTFQQINIGAMAVGTNDFSFAEPPKGRAQIPIAITITHPDAATRQVEVWTQTTGSIPQDPWTINGNIAWKTVGARATPANNFIQFPIPFVGFGGRVFIRLLGATGGGVGGCTYAFLEVPGELLTLEYMRQQFSEPFVTNTAI